MHLTPREPLTDRGVYRLAAAVLLQAIQDAGSGSIGKRTSALRWINSQDKSCYSFSFICRVLSRNPEEVRRLCERRAAERRKAYLAFRDALDSSIPSSRAAASTLADFSVS